MTNVFPTATPDPDRDLYNDDMVHQEDAVTPDILPEDAEFAREDPEPAEGVEFIDDDPSSIVEDEAITPPQGSSAVDGEEAILGSHDEPAPERAALDDPYITVVDGRPETLGAESADDAASGNEA